MLPETTTACIARNSRRRLTRLSLMLQSSPLIRSSGAQILFGEDLFPSIYHLSVGQLVVPKLQRLTLEFQE
jgi:hypothetical protein